MNLPSSCRPALLRGLPYLARLSPPLLVFAGPPLRVAQGVERAGELSR